MGLNPPNEWGTKADCGYNLSHFRGGRIRWKARAIGNPVNVQFLIGGVRWYYDEPKRRRVDSPFPDTMPYTQLGAVRSLTSTWSEFNWSLAHMEESKFFRVVGVFGWTVSWSDNGVELVEFRGKPVEPRTLHFEVKDICYEVNAAAEGQR